MGKYEEALERARQGKPIDEVFPELKESEDERIRKGLIEIFNTALGQDFLQRKAGLDRDKVITYLEKQKEQKCINSETPKEWSEEDKKRIQRIYDFMWKNRKGDTDTIHQIEKDADWLKALCSQPKRCDTYYDIIHNIFDTLKDMDFMKITPEHRASLLNDIRVKCKNADECAAILDEPHWKPSEEQIAALNCVLELNNPNEPIYRDIITLRNDLKKLK